MSGVLDERIVGELKEIMGEDLGVLFETFIVDSQDKISQLKDIVFSTDLDAIRRLAHSLKGSSRNVGANNLANHCEKLEQDARNDSLGDRQRYFDDISETFHITKTAIHNDLLS